MGGAGSLYSVLDYADSSLQDTSNSLASEPSRVLHMECSRCFAVKSNTNTPLYVNGAFRSVFCQGCKHSTNAKLWQCLCGHPWFRCTRHSAVGFSILRAHNHGTIRSATAANLVVPEAGAGVPVHKVRRRCIPDDHDKPSTFDAQRPTRKRKRTLSALDAVDRIRLARANPFDVSLGPAYPPQAGTLRPITASNSSASPTAPIRSWERCSGASNSSAGRGTLQLSLSPTPRPEDGGVHWGAQQPVNTARTPGGSTG